MSLPSSNQPLITTASSLDIVVNFSLFWKAQPQFFFCMSEVMVGNVRRKKIDLWPLTFQGQISQAQNAILEIAFFSAGVFSAQIIYVKKIKKQSKNEALWHSTPNKTDWECFLW